MMSVSKRKRTKKTSSGERSSSQPVHLTEVEKALQNKGVVDAYKPAEAKTSWRGVGELRGPVFDQAQADENRRLYPHLFSDSKRGLR